MQQEFNHIIAALSQFEHGASIEEIEATIKLTISRRTLQRRLAALQEQGLITTSGRTQGKRYYVVSNGKSRKPDHTNEIIEHGFPLSGYAIEIQRHVTMPESMRNPMGYNTDFLYGYRPNIDSYLTDAEKKRLSDFGKTGNQQQPAGTFAKEILQRLLIDLSWNSSRLEGNTYSLLDTQRLISSGEVADSKSQMEAQMILNHKDAIEFIVQGNDGIGVNRYTIQNLHALLSNNLLPDPSASGRLRTFAVGIAKSVYTPLAIPQRIEEMFDMLLVKAEEIENPFEQALFLMVQLPYLQPFDDVNKRVSRIAANIPLNKHNLAPLSFVDVPQDLYIQGMIGVYELNRVELLKDVFLWAYERSALRYAALRQSLGDPDPFRLKYREEIRALIADIVSRALTPKEGTKVIESFVKQLPTHDKSRFIEIVETEILALHEGNFARYRILPSEYKAWRNNWPK